VCVCVCVCDQAGSGIYSLLPMGVRAVEKLTALVDRQMGGIGEPPFTR
jgi:prolyl-tRNA synthetase